MRRLSRLVFAAGALIATALPTLASPEGVWELETRDTRFALQTCGDGSQVCGQLVWLSEADYNEQYKPYLNKPMADRLMPAGPNRWKGEMTLFGHKVAGTLTQRSANQMTLQGCAFLVVCKSYDMFRHSE
ncbi:DUF2147 domain-containing protein [Devosia chinhatensis]|nr:DUF2147 domain-containing protein [Devosia chinhatensis]